jgi:hypothetical protein
LQPVSFRRSPSTGNIAAGIFQTVYISGVIANRQLPAILQPYFQTVFSGGTHPIQQAQDTKMSSAYIFSRSSGGGGREILYVAPLFFILFYWIGAGK